MLELEERLEAATRELRGVLDKASLRPASAVKRRHQHRRHTITVFAAFIAVLAVVGLGFLVTRDVESTEPGSPIDPAAARLLFPADGTEAGVPSLYLGPDVPPGAKVLVEAPDGALFRVAINERGGWQETPNVERRDINGRNFTVESVDDEFAYVTLDDCAVLGIDQWGPDAAAWDTAASALLDSITINGLTASIALPPEFESFGLSNGGGHLIQLAFTSRAGGALHGVNLMQAPGSGAAALARFAPSDGPPSSTTFNNQPAWTMSDTPSSTVALIWQDGPNAVLLSGQATLEELKQIAGSLEHNHADDWARLLSSGQSLTGSVGTTPPATAEPGVSTIDPTACGTPTLTITPASAAPASG